MEKWIDLREFEQRLFDSDVIVTIRRDEERAKADMYDVIVEMKGLLDKTKGRYGGEDAKRALKIIANEGEKLHRHF